MLTLIAALSKAAVDSFLSGATAAISLYCGVKTPRNRRKNSMIKITKPADLEKIHDENIKSYIYNLLNYILTEYKKYCPDSSSEEIGAIFLLESESDYVLYEEMGLSMPITEKRFEWIETVESDYCNGAIVIDNDKAINIIGRKEYFEKFMEDTEQ